MKNKIFIKIAYLYFSFLAKITKGKKHVNQKLIYGSIIIAMMTVNSCRTTPPHRCYAPVLVDDNETSIDADTTSVKIDH